MDDDLSEATVLRGAEHTHALERELGRGGFGVTHLARRDGLAVALEALLATRALTRVRP